MSLMNEWKSYYRISPTDLSMDSIKTLRWTSALGLMTCFISLFAIWGVIPTNGYVILGIFCGLVLASLSLFHRIPNLLSLTDKHLDEWSKTVKKDAESFGFRVIFYFLLFLLIPAFMLLGSDMSDLNIVLTPRFNGLLFTLLLLPVTLQFIISCRLAWTIKPLSAADVKDMSEIEHPRKYGKWMTYMLLAGFFLGAFGGIPANIIFKDKIANMTESCVIKMETDVPLIQVKNLRDCQTLVKSKEQE